MKKIFSPVLSFLLMLAVIHLSVATHYCQGTLAGSKISVAGDLASCGMESGKQDLTPGLHYSSHCCDNTLKEFGITSSFMPSYKSNHTDNQISVPFLFLEAESTDLSSVFKDTSLIIKHPPGDLMSTFVDLSAICVYRI